MHYAMSILAVGLSRQWCLGSSKARAGFSKKICDMTKPEKRGRLIRHLEDALELADEIDDSQTDF
jgi:hypothetical protein